MNNLTHNGLSITDYGGEGEPLIFIHAFPLCNRVWDRQVEYFKDKYRIITYDLRGLGYSTEFEDYQYMMENHVDDLFAIMDCLNIEKVHVCGLSMGGYITLRAVTKEPGRFLSVILADTRAEKDDDAGLLARSAMFNKVKSGGKDELKIEFTKKLLSEKSYQKDEIRSFVEMMISWQSEKGICGALISLATRTTTLVELEALEIPALIIVGDEDILTPPEFSERMHKALEGSTLKIISSAGHLTCMEKPEEFNKAIEDFLTKI